MRSLLWDDRVWRGLEDAMSPMPPPVRREALRLIIEAAEAAAQARGAIQVEEQDVVQAAREKVPPQMRQTCLDALAAEGMKID